jgi:hypothetical protein
VDGKCANGAALAASLSLRTSLVPVYKVSFPVSSDGGLAARAGEGKASTGRR